ncbi:hypothetical protein JX265_000933 [Neoarthrinium moseri]|uniref:Uncharacterized protein n=1 Tax=Neoarthrinium moseri TaxID=1658444 RepID=A0A9P9WWR4_9PEZI|nr:uncharacterized protein JN550_004793 [Neoarthrinium moseri]KAI1846008.1 hypothetical protein JX266_007817 [Neoarthrinium moseri]KAI1871348.1 hypothetical protein JN550_004793 [Neoarthrinium moseri]KAI1880693.1 hypothetical protein JX265_000933 [Neoarthrinium moseri]
MSEKTPSVYYTVDPETNPSTWPGSSHEGPGNIDISKVDVIFININGASDFNILRTGTNKDIHHAVLQVAKHVARGLYRLVSLNASEYSCVVVMATEKQRDMLMWKNGFPWDTEEDPQPEVVLK